MKSFVVTDVILKVTLVAETAPVCVSVVAVVISRPQQEQEFEVAPKVSVTVEAPEMPVH